MMVSTKTFELHNKKMGIQVYMLCYDTDQPVYQHSMLSASATFQ